jgi:SagB-type dehydrogenase family enzyme
VYVKPGRVEGMDGGIYRYDPQHRALQPVAPGATMGRDVHAEVNQSLFDQAGFSLFLIAKTGAVATRYGALARDFCLLEAGYMGQLLMTVAPDHRLGLCPLGSVDFDRISGDFHLAPDQVLVHCLLGGAVAQAVDPAGMEARNALPETLRRRLSESLPEYMVPSTWLVLDALPLSSNGKVDRRALPSPEQAARGPISEVYVAPDSDLGRLVARIWEEELQVDRVGRDDNFFELGGNSLHMVRVQARLSEAIGRELRITELFKYPTVGALTRELAAGATPTRPSFDSLREQADKQRRAIERQRQRRREKAPGEDQG